MAPEIDDYNDSEFVITIEYENYLTRFDLDEVIASMDSIIEEEILYLYEPEFRFFSRRFPWFPFQASREPEFSYIGITSVQSGSISLTVVISAAIATYVARRFKKGIDKSLLAEELERSGRLIGDSLGNIVQRINKWAEQYVPRQRERGGHIKDIKIERKNKNRK